MISLKSQGLGAGGAAPGPKPYFSFARASSDAQREATYRIRYQVYCIERAFLDRADYPGGLEHDEFDPCSVHILAAHASGEPAGTARLVLHSPKGFPLQRHCGLAPEYADLGSWPAEECRRYAEISRLAVSKSFRRREGDTLYGGPPRFQGQRSEDVVAFPMPRQTPEIVSGIYRVLYQESKRCGVLHWIVAMERGLQIILNRMGFSFTPIGPKVDYFGPVRPYVATIANFERHLYRGAPELLRFMLAGLEPELWPDCVRGAEDDWSAVASIA